MPERKNLFRNEAILYRNVANGSAAIYHSSKLLRHLILISVLILSLALILLSQTNYKETQAVRGVLEPKGGVQKIVSPAVAVVKELSVESGQTVVAGQILATLDATNYDHEGRPLEQKKIEQLQTDLAYRRQEKEIQALLQEQLLNQQQDKRYSLQKRIAIANKESTILDSQLRLSKNNLDAALNLLNRSAISQSQYDQRHAAQLDLQRQQQALAQAQQQLLSQLQVLLADEELLKTEFTQSSLLQDMLISSLGYQVSQLSQQQLLTVIAPADGVVATIVIERDQSVRANQPLFYINPEGTELKALLYAPARVQGRLYPGQEVLLRYDAFNYQHYGRYSAVVESISQASLNPQEHLLPVLGITEPVFEVVAKIAQEYVSGPEIYRLQTGMQLTADFVIAEMSLMSFIIKPLLRLRGRVW